MLTSESKTTILPISELPEGVVCRFYSDVAEFLKGHPEVKTAYYNAKTKLLFVPMPGARVELV